MVWKAVVHSEIGTRHHEFQKPCQDYGHYRIIDSVIVGAVADGAGSAQYADVGAQIAVQTALTTLEDWADGWSTLTLDEREIEAHILFSTVLKEVVMALENQAIAEHYPLKELGCTLLAIIATPECVAAMQIGDGFIVVRPTATPSYQLLFPPTKGEFVNETMFVTSNNALDHLQVGVYSVPEPFICMATDGLESVAIRFQDWQPHPPFFQPFVDCLSSLEDPHQRQNYLETFLASDRLNARTDDDKTLLLGIYQQQESQ